MISQLLVFVAAVYANDRKLPPGRSEQRSLSSHMACQDAAQDYVRLHGRENCKTGWYADTEVSMAIDSFNAVPVRDGGSESFKASFKCRVHQDYKFCTQSELQRGLDGYHQMTCSLPQMMIWYDESYTINSNALCMSPSQYWEKLQQLKSEAHKRGLKQAAEAIFGVPVDLEVLDRAIMDVVTCKDVPGQHASSSGGGPK